MARTKDERRRIASEMKALLRLKMLREAPISEPLWDNLYCRLMAAIEKWEGEAS